MHFQTGLRCRAPGCVQTRLSNCYAFLKDLLDRFSHRQEHFRLGEPLEIAARRPVGIDEPRARVPAILDDIQVLVAQDGRGRVARQRLAVCLLAQPRPACGFPLVGCHLRHALGRLRRGDPARCAAAQAIRARLPDIQPGALVLQDTKILGERAYRLRWA